jgi:hypothetical protein
MELETAIKVAMIMLLSYFMGGVTGFLAGIEWLLRQRH